MRPRELTEALAAILSSGTLRAEFRKNPPGLARQLGLCPEDREAFLNLDPGELEVQARGLKEKRYSELRALLPQSIGRLGAGGRAWFDAYSEEHWPSGHRRHLQDAVAFADYLARRGVAVLDSEVNLLRFHLGERRIWLGCVRDLLLGGRRRPGLQFLYRRRGRVRQATLYLRF